MALSSVLVCFRRISAVSHRAISHFAYLRNSRGTWPHCDFSFALSLSTSKTYQNPVKIWAKKKRDFLSIGPKSPLRLGKLVHFTFGAPIQVNSTHQSATIKRRAIVAVVVEPAATPGSRAACIPTARKFQVRRHGLERDRMFPLYCCLARVLEHTLDSANVPR